MFTLNAKQKAIEAAYRAKAFGAEVGFAGLDAEAAAQMDEADLVRELNYRQGILVGNAAPVGPEAWRRIDDRATVLMRDVLVVFERLRAANSTPVSMGDLVSYYPQVSNSGEATVSMDGRHTGRSDQALVKYGATPTPLVTSEVRFGWRQMEVIRKAGNLIDAESIANAQRIVAETLEDMVLNGNGTTVGGATIYGLRTHPNRNTASHGLTLASATGAQWDTAIKACVSALIGDKAFGKVTFFLNYSDWFAMTSTEYTAGYPKKIIAVLREIEQVADFVPASKVPANNIIGIAGLETGGWGSILTGMGMTTRPKARLNPEDDYVYSVIASATPQFRTDYDGNMPLIHATT